MLKKLPFIAVLSLFFVFLLSDCSSAGGGDLFENSNISAVIVTRIDGLSGSMYVFVDGRKRGKLPPGGKFGWRLSNGRHSVSVTYGKKRSQVVDFMIFNNRQNFKASSYFAGDPLLEPF
ncbi:MAG: hypothetical protein LBD07_01870 [Spirochaetaceae bacterium]|nr:hypothetical protein [Spirochaetaceae bacterium]